MSYFLAFLEHLPLDFDAGLFFDFSHVDFSAVLDICKIIL